MLFTSWIERVGRSWHRGSRRKDARRECAGLPGEQLEERTLLSVSALFVAGELNIALESTDSVAVSENPAVPGTVLVLGNGLPVSSVSGISASQVTKILIEGGDDANTIDLTGVTASAFLDPSLSIEVHAGNGDDTLLGSVDLADSLDGGHGDDSINGNGGNDTLLGNDGDDSISGNAGNDSIDSGDGQDTVDGNAGDDTILAGDGEDLVDGSAGNDSISGDDGVDTLRGGDGNDTLNGMAGTDSIDGQVGNDSIYGGNGDDTLIGGDGNDTIDGNSGIDSLLGSDGDDSLTGSAGNDTMSGEGGNDTLNGSADQDTLDGGDGNDSLLGGAGADSMSGGLGDDTARGQSGNDTVLGGGGVDSLDGGDGSDLVQSVTNSLFIDDFIITEGDSGNVFVTFTVSLAFANTDTVTVDFSTADVSAVAGSDYVATSGTLTFAPGVLSQTIAVAVIGDTTIEATELFVVNLSNATNAAISDAQGQTTILDNDTPVGNFAVPIVNVAGQGFTGVHPPDTDGEAGPNHYVQVINGAAGALVRVFNKTGTVLTSFAMSSLATGGPAANGLGDGMVVYDQLADRWVLMEFSGSSNGFAVYVSQTPDPTNGLWNNYFFATAEFPDYPKISVWPDAYYITTNESNPAVYALDRTNMLTGAAARPIQRFQGPSLAGLGFQAFSPADLEGATAPATGSNAYFMRQDDDELNNPGGNNPAADTLQLWQFHVDFTTPANSNFSQLATLSVTEFDADFTRSPLFQGFGSIQQPNGTLVDPIPEVIMSRTHYRNFGTHESIVGTFVTDTNNTDHAGVRWFELRRVGAGAWTLFQEGLVNPDNVVSRWMPSIDMDGAGNIAVGYSVSGTTTFPGIRYTGRLAADPLGTMPQGEFTIIDGTGSQQNSDRWGDYASMTVDPADDHTFWFTSEFGLANGNWATQIASFAFPVSVPGGGGGSTGGGGAIADVGDTLLGGNGSDSIIGGSGDDAINLGADNDTALGGAGNDSILGGSGMDRLDGQAGDDTLVGQGGKDTLIGGEGDDVFQWNATTDGDDVVSSTNGSDQMVVTTGGAGDIVSVGKMKSSMTVTSGANVLVINPTIRIVSIDLGAGGDTLTIGSLLGVTPTLLTIDGNVGDDVLDASTGVLGSVRLRLNGGDGNDSITGSVNDDTLDGGAGNDLLLGGSGDDTLLGGADADTLNGNKGNDSLQGDDGNDGLMGGDGNDLVRGGLGNDNMNGNSGADTVEGNDGRDTLQGSAGNDSLDGGVGRDYLTGGDGDDTVDGGRNDDTIFGDAGADAIRGDHGNDSIDGGVGADTINGGDGNDTILSGDDADLVAGGDGDDNINAGGGNDIVTGGDGKDTLLGGGGSDVVLGDDGDDVVNGQSGSDTVAGGMGVDTIIDPASEINEHFKLSSDLLLKLGVM